MAKSARQKQTKSKPQPPKKPVSALWLVCLLALVAMAGVAYWISKSKSSHTSAVYVSRPVGMLTFNKDIAKILIKNCAGCHRPSQAAPFNLLTYQDVKKRAQQIAEVTQSRFMPPWPPEPGFGEFLDQRVLSVEQIGLIQQWFAEGAVEGASTDLPPLPKWPDGWQLGEPDLVIQMPEPYSLAADGKDVYRNFVIPIPVSTRRYVAGIEFRPGNHKVIHHAAMRLDSTPLSRRVDSQEPGPGFGGMTMPESTRMPSGQFLNWQPGKVAYLSPEGFSWALEPGTDFVLQLHLKPSGKPETVQSSIGFYFTDKPPAKESLKIILDDSTLDIPPGKKDYTITDSYRLPVDVEVLAVFPHAHYLAREMQGFATLPDGTKQWLLLIRNWDFNWQGDYRFAKPLFLPKGSTLAMQFTYDNSAENARNPHRPPQRVRFGPQTTDEMGELWIQAVPRNPADFALLSQDYRASEMKKLVASGERRLEQNSTDTKTRLNVGKALLGFNRTAEALQHFRTAVALDGNSDEAHYNLGLMQRMQGEHPSAMAEFTTALRLNPEHYKAHGNLALLLMEQGDRSQAEAHFKEALRVNPADAISHSSLGALYLEAGNLSLAEYHLQNALRLDPSDAEARQFLQAVAKASLKKN